MFCRLRFPFRISWPGASFTTVLLAVLFSAPFLARATPTPQAPDAPLQIIIDITADGFTPALTTIRAAA